jgi:hypothetical protein
MQGDGGGLTGLRCQFARLNQELPIPSGVNQVGENPNSDGDSLSFERARLQPRRQIAKRGTSGFSPEGMNSQPLAFPRRLKPQKHARYSCGAAEATPFQSNEVFPQSVEPPDLMA